MSDLSGLIKAIDKFIPADPMESDYTQGISVGLAIATGCIEKFSQENAESSQGLVKNLINRQEAKDAIDMALDRIDHVPTWVYDNLLNALNEVPSAEPKTPSNGSITYINPENTHDRTMGDCISRKGAIKSMANAIWHYPNELYKGLNSYEMCEALAKDGLMFLPSAEPEPKPISYMDCANAMLKMWIDNVLTDGEYNRIMDKLNSKHMAERRGEEDEID